MNEERAREILKDAIQPDGGLDRGPYLDWVVGGEDAILDDRFTADQLEAIAWWMRNKSEQ